MNNNLETFETVEVTELFEDEAIQTVQKVGKKKKGINILAIILSLITISLAVFSIIEFRQVSSNKAEIQSLKTKITDIEKSKQDLSNKNVEISATLNETSSKLDTALSDVIAKKADLDNVNKDLTAKQADLAKAQKGIAKLSELDNYFSIFDTNATAGYKLSDEGLDAYNAGNESLAQMKFDQSDIYYQKSSEAYTKIKALLDDFRNGKY